jgi:hypothetical protein
VAVALGGVVGVEVGAGRSVPVGSGGRVGTSLQEASRDAVRRRKKAVRNGKVWSITIVFV